ncbi:MAG TPA: cytochrome c oxidase subunit 3 [Xanthobacteraceae bacterium]|jgi:heme/copper-type cytochrome/quinol oxidase subunit 3|nr:cytochrome c oxidase subunit 3 [Xanthobacteraceae bacterium]
MKVREFHDVSDLPTWGFRSSTPWWGTLAFMTIEGTAFAILIGAYLYLAAVDPHWPPTNAPANPWPGTALVLLLLASLWPNWWTNRAAERQDLRRVRIALIVMSLIGLAAIAARGLEIALVGLRWDINAYGSMVWIVLGLHATHLVTDVADTLVLTALMFTRHAQPRRFSDVTDNAFYWYFVVASWLPLYALIYWFPYLAR